RRERSGRRSPITRSTSPIPGRRSPPAGGRGRPVPSSRASPRAAGSRSFAAGAGSSSRGLCAALPPGGGGAPRRAPPPPRGGEAADPALRSALARWGAGHPERARRFLAVNDPVSAERIAPGNLRYVLRAIEILLSTGAAASSRAREGEEWTARWRVVKIGVRP